AHVHVLIGKPRDRSRTAVAAIAGQKHGAEVGDVGLVVGEEIEPGPGDGRIQAGRDRPGLYGSGSPSKDRGIPPSLSTRRVGDDQRNARPSRYDSRDEPAADNA